MTDNDRWLPSGQRKHDGQILGSMDMTPLLSVDDVRRLVMWAGQVIELRERLSTTDDDDLLRRLVDWLNRRDEIVDA